MNGSYTNIRANSTCDLGTSAIPYQTLYSNASIAGTINSRLTNDIVSNTSTGVTGNLPSFVSAKVIGDSGIVASTLTGGPFLKLDGTSSMLGGINLNTNALTNVTTINTKTANDLVTSAVNGALNMVATYDGISKAIQSSGTLISDLATNVALNAGLALKVAKAGDTMSGALAMGTNNITNVGTLSGATNSRTADNILSSTVNPTYGNLPMWSLTNKVFDDPDVSSFNVVSGPASAVNNNLASYNLTTGKIIKDSGLLTSNVFKVDGTVAMTGVLNQSNTTDSSSISTGSIVTLGGLGVAKQATIGGLLRVTQTNSATTSSDGSISTLGGLSTAKNIIVGDITDASSSITGSLKTAGGLGVAKKAFIGDTVSIGTSSANAQLQLANTVVNRK